MALDGAADEIVYESVGTILSATSQTWIIEFIPHFAANEATLRYFWDTGFQHHYLRREADGDLTLMLAGDTIGSCVLANWQGYWVQNGRNQIVVAAASGSFTQLYLNGTQVATWATAWAPQVPPSGIVLGSDSTGTDFFDGVISHVAILGAKWNASEASDWWTGRTYRYRDEAIGYWPMLDRDVSGATTRDRSRLGLDLTEAVTKLASRGYYCDGTVGPAGDRRAQQDEHCQPHSRPPTALGGSRPAVADRPPPEG